MLKIFMCDYIISAFTEIERNMYKEVNKSIWNDETISEDRINEINYICDVIYTAEIVKSDIETGIARDYESDDLVWTC